MVKLLPDCNNKNSYGEIYNKMKKHIKIKNKNLRKKNINLQLYVLYIS